MRARTTCVLTLMQVGCGTWPNARSLCVRGNSPSPTSSSNEYNFSDAVSAWHQAIRGALDIATDQVSHGSPYFGAEVRLEEGNKLIGRYVVSAGASPLKD